MDISCSKFDLLVTIRIFRQGTYQQRSLDIHSTRVSYQVAVVSYTNLLHAVSMVLKDGCSLLQHLFTTLLCSLTHGD